MGVFRLILALAVVLGHTAYEGPRLMSPGDAVHIFFVISGFYMCMVIRRKYGCSARGVGVFYLNRFLRLYPTFLFAVIGSMAWYFFCRWSTGGTGKPAAIMELAGWLPSWGWWALWVPNFTLVGVDLPAWFNALADGGVALAGPANAPVMGEGAYWLGYGLWVGPSWTIGCEIWFYAMAPLVLARGPWLRIVGAGALSAALYLLVSRYFLYGGYFIWVFWFWLFALGMVGFLVYEKVEGRVGEFFQKNPVSGWVVAGLCWAAFTVPYLLGWKIPSWVVITAAVPLVPLLFHITKSNRADRILGEFSYPVYCTHMLAAEINQTLIGLLKMDWGWLVWMNVGTTLAASAVCVFLIEQPLERARSRIAAGAKG